MWGYGAFAFDSEGSPMHQNYAPFLDRMINNYEGGYGWDGGDPGGPTKYGITCYDLAAHRGKTMNSMAEWAPIVKAMTLQEAEDIYWMRYAVPMRFNDLPSGVDCCIMDYGVNSGVGRSLLVASQIAKVSGVSGATMDPRLLTAIQKMDPAAFISAMDKERLAFLHAIKGGAMWATFGRGWGARVADLDTYCHHLASLPVTVPAPKAVDLSEVPTPKAVVKNNTSKTAGVAAAAAATMGMATAGNGVQTSVVLVLMGIVLAVALAYGLYEGYLDSKASVVHT